MPLIQTACKYITWDIYSSFLPLFTVPLAASCVSLEPTVDDGLPFDDGEKHSHEDCNLLPCLKSANNT